MSKNIFITRKIPEVAEKMLTGKGYVVDVNPHDRSLSQRELVRFLRKKPYDAVLSLLTDHLDAYVFDAAPSIKIFANYATGFDNIDIAEAKKRGVTITNTPAPLLSESVAEHTIAMILALATRIVEADRFTRRGRYKGWEPMGFVGVGVAGKTVGLVGAGRIGERVAICLKSFGLKIIYHDVSHNERIEKECGAQYINTIEELLAQADFVTLHVPLLDSTRHLINETRLRIMKPTAFIINTARGAVIDESALERALKQKIISGAALDVFEFEPKITPGLTKLDNVILTPHIGSASAEARNQMAEMAAQNIIDFLEGKTPPNIVSS